MNRLLTTKQVSKMLNVGIGRVSKLITKGELQSFRIGKLHRVSAFSVDAYLERKKDKLPKVKYPTADEIWSNINQCRTTGKTK